MQQVCGPLSRRRACQASRVPAEPHALPKARPQQAAGLTLPRLQSHVDIDVPVPAEGDSGLVGKQQVHAPATKEPRSRQAQCMPASPRRTACAHVQSRWESAGHQFHTLHAPPGTARHARQHSSADATPSKVCVTLPCMMELRATMQPSHSPLVLLGLLAPRERAASMSASLAAITSASPT